MTSGIEWNYRFFKSDKPEDYDKFSTTFNELFYYNSIKITPEVLKSYAANWKKPAFVRIEDSIGECLRPDSEEVPKPRGAQIEALYELKKAREEGISKGLVVVAATGVGKTYLAAFDSLEFNRILFVAHREEIIKQAEKIFKTVRPEIRTGFFTGTQKDDGAGAYFATVQTLTKMQNLDYLIKIISSG